jgi:short-subunit dehydrogenase
MPKYALISGGTGGIGTQLCIQFAKRGYKVFAFAPEKYLDEAKELLSKYDVVPYAFDISNSDEIKNAVKFIEQNTEGGNLDILYNNAGIAYGSPAIEFDDQALFNIFNINCLGHILLTKYMAPSVINRKGSIIFTASIAGRIPLTWCSLYGATKAAIDQYAWGLHTEMAPLGVKVHSVITGGVDTLIATRADNSMVSSYYDVPGIEECIEATQSMTKTGTKPEVYAKQVVDVIVKKKALFNIYRGAESFITYLLYKIFPVWLVEYLVSRQFKANVVWKNLRKRNTQLRT